jgi:hypothetical protein
LIVEPLELNEVLAFLCVILAVVATVSARIHRANTERTRRWWTRFLGMLLFILAAQAATNIEQFYADGSASREAVNLLEHFCFLLGAVSAIWIATRGVLEAAERSVEVGEGTL